MIPNKKGEEGKGGGGDSDKNPKINKQENWRVTAIFSQWVFSVKRVFFSSQRIKMDWQNLLATNVKKFFFSKAIGAVSLIWNFVLKNYFIGIFMKTFLKKTFQWMCLNLEYNIFPFVSHILSSEILKVSNKMTCCKQKE